MTLKRISFLLVVFLAACSPKKKLPEGAPSLLSNNRLWENIHSNSLEFETLELKGNGSYEDSKGTKLSFRYTLRVLKDSLIWIDLADPLLGLKLVRAQITAKEVAYYNRLDRSYFKGNSEELAANAGFSFDFEPLMAIISANVIEWDQEWHQEFIQNYYRINNYPEDQKGAGASPLMKQTLFSESFRPMSFDINRPRNNETMRVDFQGYKDFDGHSYPEKIAISVSKDGINKVEINVRSLELNQNPKFPFRIPNNYNAL